MNIFVAKLNFKTQSEDLRAAFETFGEVDSAKVIVDHFTGKSRGFGFVEMPNDDEARAAIEALNESQMDGNTIVVKQAEPRKRPGGRDNGGGGYRERNDYGDRGGYRDRNDRGGDRGGYRDRNDRGGDRNDRGGDRYNRRDDRGYGNDYNRNRY